MFEGAFNGSGFAELQVNAEARNALQSEGHRSWRYINFNQSLLQALDVSEVLSA